MPNNNFNVMTVLELRNEAKSKGLSGYSKLNKTQLLSLLKEKPETNLPSIEIEKKVKKIEGEENLNVNNSDNIRFVKIKQLGKKGKEGVVFLVIDEKSGKSYAMKTFKKTKSALTLKQEALFQHKAAEAGVSPKVIEVNTKEKYIVMELMERTLFDVLKAQNNALTTDQQMQIVELFNKLDKIQIIHNDANPLNFMEKKGKFYMIDYGFAKYTSHKDFKEYPRPNYQLMTLGLLTWLKGKTPTKSWRYIRDQIPTNVYKRLDMENWI